MNGNDRGYTLVISMIALLMLTTLSGLLVMSTQSEVRSSRTTRADLQAHYVAEEGIMKALLWFQSSYSLPATSLVNTAPGTPPSFTDPLGKTYTTSVSLTNGSPVVLNATNSGTATTHPSSYTSVLDTSISNLTTSFQSSLGNQSVSLDPDGSGSFSAMATLIKYNPERWRIDSVGTFAGKTKAVSVWIERLPLLPYVEAAYTSASPVDLTGNQSLDGRDHALDGTLLSGAGLPGVAVTSASPLPSISGSGQISSTVSGSTVTVTSSTVHPSPLPENYPITNSLDPNVYPYTPAAALGLDPAIYQPYLDSRSATTVPCVIKGLVVLNMNFPTGSGGACGYSGTGILILHNLRYDPRYFDPTNPLYTSSTSPIAGQTAEQYRADTANQPRYFNYNATNTYKGIVIADSIGEIGPGISGNANILGGIISLDRVNGSIGTGNATLGYSSVAIANAINSMPYTKQRGTFRHLTQ